MFQCHVLKCFIEKVTVMILRKHPSRRFIETDFGKIPQVWLLLYFEFKFSNLIKYLQVVKITKRLSCNKSFY